VHAFIVDAIDTRLCEKCSLLRVKETKTFFVARNSFDCASSARDFN